MNLPVIIKFVIDLLAVLLLALGIKGLSKVKSARDANRLAAFAMSLSVVGLLSYYLGTSGIAIQSWIWIIIGSIHQSQNIDIGLVSDIFLKSLITSKAYKKSKPIIQLIYSFIEVYFRNNISTKNIKLFHLYHYFLKKINDTKIYNLDEETLLMEFEDKVLNG